MLNFPLGDTLAVRLVLSDTYRSGWINNITVQPFPDQLEYHDPGQRPATAGDERLQGCQRPTLYGGRISLKYKPSEDFSVLAFAMTKACTWAGTTCSTAAPTSASCPAASTPRTTRHFRSREGVRDDISIFGLTVKANLGFADLTSATSYFGRLGVPNPGRLRIAFIIRIRSPTGGHRLVSGYAARADSLRGARSVPPVEPGNPLDVARCRWLALGGGRLLQQSAFGVERDRQQSAVAIATPRCPTARYSPPGTITGSDRPRYLPTVRTSSPSNGSCPRGRAITTTRATRTSTRGATTAPTHTPPANSKITTAKNSGANPRVNLSYEPGPDLTAYATVSKGFRPGGANQILPPPTSPPYCQQGALQFGPDSAWNYELGEKARLFDNWLTINSDVYYIKWNDIQQVITLPCGYQYYNNAGNGRSFGPELEINAKLSDEMDRRAQRRLDGCEDHQPERLVHELPRERRDLPGRCDPPCTAGYKCTVPIMNVVKDTASLSLDLCRHAWATIRSLRAPPIRSWAHPTTWRTTSAYKLPSYSLVNARVGLGAGRLDGRPVSSTI